jgi:hypothetical protein
MVDDGVVPRRVCVHSRDSKQCTAAPGIMDSAPRTSMVLANRGAISAGATQERSHHMARATALLH